MVRRSEIPIISLARSSRTVSAESFESELSGTKTESSHEGLEQLDSFRRIALWEGRRHYLAIPRFPVKSISFSFYFRRVLRSASSYGPSKSRVLVFSTSRV